MKYKIIKLGLNNFSLWLDDFKKLHYLKTDEEAVIKLIEFYKAYNKLVFELRFLKK